MSGLSKDLVAASATPIVLSILREGESYGYAIIKRVKELSDDQIQWSDGMLYPVLHRLEQQGFVTSRVAKVESGRRRRYYRLEIKGKEAIDIHKSQWNLVQGVLTKLWEPITCSI